MWVIYNEGWGQWDTQRMTDWATQYDPTRLINPASGWTDRGVGHVHDIHSYPGPASPKPTEKRAAVLGEFGGLGLGVDGHTWDKKTWGYQQMSSTQAVTKRYVGLLAKVHQFKAAPGLCAAIYTQTTDVETECNGLMTYDREVMKVDIDQVAPANKGDFPPPPEMKVVVPTSQKDAQTWKYTLEAPAEGWFKPLFDTAAWKEGKGGFGTAGTPDAVVGTEWKGKDIWLVREFTLDKAEFKAPQLRMHHDEDAEVYINGVPAVKVTGFTTEYTEVEMTPEGKAALKAGKNTLAVHCKQTTGGQFIDVGIVDAK